MRAAGGRRRRPRESSTQLPPPSLPRHAHHRDSDASFASSRPSSVGIGRSTTTSAVGIVKDRNFQHKAVDYINEFLSVNSSPHVLRHSSIPSGKEIIEILMFVLEKLDYPCSEVDEDLPLLLKTLNCPFKVSKSAIRTPATPTAWPSVCAVIYWLAELATISVELENKATEALENDAMQQYALSTYRAYIRGDDAAVEELDNEFAGKLDLERDSAGKCVEELRAEVEELERKVEEMKKRSRKEELDKQRELFEKDVEKFHTMIAGINQAISEKKEELEVKEKELAMKLDESKRISEENAELKKQVELQTFNARDVERMRRELQVLERDIEESEAARSSWEEKCWDVDSDIGHKFKELEELSMESNKSMRRLKLADSLQFKLNVKGSTAVEVMGIDYKTELKPALKSMADGVKKSHMEKLEELITLKKNIQENAKKIDAKKIHLDELQAYIDEAEAQVNLFKKETHDYIQKSVAECKEMEEAVSLEAYNLESVETDAEEILKTTKMNLQQAAIQSEDEIQIYAHELFKVVNSITEYKEFVASTISELKNDIAETSIGISNAYKDSLHPHIAGNKKLKM